MLGGRLQPSTELFTNEDIKSMWIIVTGDVRQGFDYYGPFDTSTDARQWAESNGGDDWLPNWIEMEVTPPFHYHYETN